MLFLPEARVPGKDVGLVKSDVSVKGCHKTAAIAVHSSKLSFVQILW